LKTVATVALAAFFISAGIGHFVYAEFLESIVPSWLPFPSALQYIAGVAELAGGFGLLIPKTRVWAAWGLVALLIAVFPANVDMALNPHPWPHAPAFLNLDEPDPAALWFRLPIQGVFIAWAWWLTRKGDGGETRAG